MRLGFNFTLGDTYDMVQRLLAEGHIDYCEFLIDNFFCVDPEELSKAFDCPIGLHIMYSKFLGRVDGFDPDECASESNERRIVPCGFFAA